MKTYCPSASDRRRTASALAGLVRGAFFGFILGLLISLLAGSWVWLEMRVNVGLFIPGMTLACLVASVARQDLFPYRLFALLQLLSIAVFIALYGFDPVALRIVPASFFREGFQVPAMSLDAANVALVLILIMGNAIMYMEAHLVRTRYATLRTGRKKRGIG
jgi:hypothetical protein